MNAPNLVWYNNKILPLQERVVCFNFLIWCLVSHKVTAVTTWATLHTNQQNIPFTERKWSLVVIYRPSTLAKWTDGFFLQLTMRNKLQTLFNDIFFYLILNIETQILFSLQSHFDLFHFGWMLFHAMCWPRWAEAECFTAKFTNVCIGDATMDIRVLLRSWRRKINVWHLQWM